MVTLKCLECGKPFGVSQSRIGRRKCCSDPCGRAYREQFKVSRELLLLDVWDRPTVDIAIELGVSDKAIEKRCKKLKIMKPPRSYWAKIQNGHGHEQTLASLGWSKEAIEDLQAQLTEAEKYQTTALN